MGKSVCHASFSNVRTDTRIQRSVRTLEASGYNVQLVGYGAGLEQTPIKFRNKLWTAAGQIPSRILPSKWANTVYWLRRQSNELYRQILYHKPDIIHAHDWTALPAAARAATELQAGLIYDSHEYGTGQRAHRLFWRMTYPSYVRNLEAQYIHQADHVITVGEQLAQLLQHDYNLQQQPHIIRSVPPYEEVTERHPDPHNILVHYHGIFTQGRGLRNLIKSVKLWPNQYRLRITGWAQPPSFLRTLENLVLMEGVADRIEFHSKLHNNELISHASEADIGICFWSNETLQMNSALPNKFFEYNMAGLMQLASAGNEIGALVKRHELGLSLTNNHPETLAASLSALDTEAITRYRKNARATARELCWECEQEKLLKIYTQL